MSKDNLQQFTGPTGHLPSGSALLKYVRRKVQLLAIDIDGTLTNSQGSISKKGIEAVRQAQSKGLSVVLISARAPQGIRPVARLLHEAVYKVCYLGAVILTPKGEEIQRLRLDMEVARDIAWFADRNQLSLTINIDDIEYQTQNEVRSSATPVRSVASAQHVLAVEAPVLIGTVGHNASSQLYEYCARNFADEVHLSRTFNNDGTYASLVMVNPQAQKGNALLTVCRLLSIDPLNVLSIGDSESDVSMFKVSGTSVAVGNHDPVIHQSATFISTASDGEGVHWALQQLT